MYGKLQFLFDLQSTPFYFIGVFEGTLGDGPRKVERYKFVLSAKYPDPGAGSQKLSNAWSEI
jgi:hypothetical protein